MKVKIFIDGLNFYHSMLNLGSRKRVNYDELWRQLVIATEEHSERLRVQANTFAGAHYYMGVPEEAPVGLAKFLYGLELRTGYFVTRETRRFGQATCPKCTTRVQYTAEKGVDTRLSVDMVRFAGQHSMEVAILCSGDEDYVPAIEAVNMLGVQTWVATWGCELSPSLRRACFGHIELTELANWFVYEKEEKDAGQ